MYDSLLVYNNIARKSDKKGKPMNTKKTKLHNNKVFLSWMASYAFILIIPILFASIAYSVSISTIKNEVVKSNSASLGQLKFILDGKFDEINKLGNDISMNQSLKNLLYSSQTHDIDDILYIKNIQNDLSKSKILNNFIDDIYIYINNNNYIFSGSNKYGQDEFEYISDRFFAMNLNDFSNLISTNKVRNYEIVRKDTGNGNIEKKIIFTQPLYLTDYKSVKGSLIIVIDGNRLDEMLKNIEVMSDTKILMVNDKNEFIDTGKDNTLPQFIDYNSVNNAQGTFFRKINNDNIAITSIKSDIIKLNYISLTPTKVFLQKVQYIKNMIYVYILICIIFGCLAAYFLAKRNYKPVKKLTEIFRDRLGGTINNSENEFNFMEKSITSLINENNTAMTRLKRQNEALRNNLLSRLIKGRVQSFENIKASLESYNIKFSSENYLVMLFKIEKFEGEVFDIKFSEDEEAVNLIYFIIRNVVEELVNERHLGYMTEIDGMMVCLVNAITDENEEERITIINKEMEQIADKATEFFESKFKMVVSTFISDVHHGLPGIAKSYLEALEVLEYKTIIESPDRVINYSSIQSGYNNSISNSYNLEKERLFINCIMSGDYKNAGDILDQIITNDLGKDIQSLQLTKCRMFGLVNSMINAIGEIMTADDVGFFNSLDPVNRLLKTKTVNELKIELRYIIENINKYYNAREKEQTPSWISDVMDYVGNHYFDNNLSIASISEEFNLSNSYLSRTYKKYMGFGLLDYIHKVRLEKAKLLMNTNISIKEIAERVGYQDSNALIRAFKRYEGVTPGRFRESE